MFASACREVVYDVLQMRCLHVTGRTTGEINFDASAGEVESKLEALANVGDVSVTEASTDSDTTQASAPCPPPLLFTTHTLLQPSSSAMSLLRPRPDASNSP